MESKYKRKYLVSFISLIIAVVTYFLMVLQPKSYTSLSAVMYIACTFIDAINSTVDDDESSETTRTFNLAISLYCLEFLVLVIICQVTKNKIVKYLIFGEAAVYPIRQVVYTFRNFSKLKSAKVLLCVKDNNTDITVVKYGESDNIQNKCKIDIAIIQQSKMPKEKHKGRTKKAHKAQNDTSGA